LVGAAKIERPFHQENLKKSNSRGKTIPIPGPKRLLISGPKGGPCKGTKTFLRIGRSPISGGKRKRVLLNKREA